VAVFEKIRDKFRLSAFHWGRGLNLKPIENAYDNLEFQSFIADKTKAFASSPIENYQKNIDSSKLGVLGFLNTPEIVEVIEIGGGAGIDFFIANRYVGFSKKWTIYETEAMCKVVSKHGATNPMLNFRSDISSLNSKSFFGSMAVYCNSSLQYFTDPLDMLRQLLEMKPRKIGILRTPFCDESPNFSYLQESAINDNGPQVHSNSKHSGVVQVQVNLVSVGEVRTLFAELGYTIVYEESRESNFVKTTAPRRLDVRNYLMLAEKLT